MMGGSVRRSANLILLFLVVVGFITAMLIAVSLLGIFLLPLTLVFLFLIAVYFTGGQGMSGMTIIAGIVIMFMLGLGLHYITASTLNLSTIKMATVGFSIDDSTFSAILSIGVLVVVVLFAFAGLYAQAAKRRR